MDLYRTTGNYTETVIVKYADGYLKLTIPTEAGMSNDEKYYSVSRGAWTVSSFDFSSGNYRVY